MRISDWSSDVCSSDLSANELGAVTDGRHCSAEREGQDRRQGGGCAHELADKRKRKEEAGDIGRYGIARQAQHQRVAQPARHQRLAGLQRHLDEIERGPARQKCRLYKIMVAHRSAATCKDDVSSAERRGGKEVVSKCRSRWWRYH